jgi:hypothetical protein
MAFALQSDIALQYARHRHAVPRLVIPRFVARARGSPTQSSILRASLLQAQVAECRLLTHRAQATLTAYCPVRRRRPPSPVLSPLPRNVMVHTAAARTPFALIIT